MREATIFPNKRDDQEIIRINGSPVLCDIISYEKENLMNWETEQAINMVAGNYDRKDHFYWTMIAEDILNGCKGQVKKARIRITESLAEHALESVPVTKGFYATLIGEALSQVNWEEVADVLIDTVESL